MNFLQNSKVGCSHYGIAFFKVFLWSLGHCKDICKIQLQTPTCKEFALLRACISTALAVSNNLISILSQLAVFLHCLQGWIISGHERSWWEGVCRVAKKSISISRLVIVSTLVKLLWVVSAFLNLAVTSTWKLWNVDWIGGCNSYDAVNNVNWDATATTEDEADLDGEEGEGVIHMTGMMVTDLMSEAPYDPQALSIADHDNQDLPWGKLLTFNTLNISGLTTTWEGEAPSYDLLPIVCPEIRW